MASKIAEAYAALIDANRKTIDQVPAQIKTEVQAILDSQAASEPPAE
ncbi:CD1375 family protein [Petroclostridium sp. X23]|nr:CD1375 family protein [Petroclostridium sp. X23]WHH58324.1 CD1375 family protein [Petroclostridium sp. X23]